MYAHKMLFQAAPIPLDIPRLQQTGKQISKLISQLI
jgi:hypothetical protein